MSQLFFFVFILLYAKKNQNASNQKILHGFVCSCYIYMYIIFFCSVTVLALHVILLPLPVISNDVICVHVTLLPSTVLQCHHFGTTVLLSVITMLRNVYRKSVSQIVLIIIIIGGGHVGQNALLHCCYSFIFYVVFMRMFMLLDVNPAC